MDCKNLVGKSVRAVTNEGIIIGTLQEARCPSLILVTIDGQTKKVICKGSVRKNILTPDSFWSNLTK